MVKHVLLEIGMEEVPARFIDNALEQLKQKTKDWLEDKRVTYDELTSLSTPRRLAIIIENIADEQLTINEETRGPAVNIAKDETGEWTKAAIGFAKGQEKTVDDLFEKEVNGKTYVFISKEIVGKKTEEILPELKGIITSLAFPNTMRWGKETIQFVRPIRWLTAIYGDEVIPFEIANVHTDNITYGHRYLGDSITIKDALEYEEKLKENYVIADSTKRKELILEGIKEIEKEKGFDVLIEADLLSEVTNLVEYPTVFQGSFAEEFLELPSEVLIISMKEHQRYFPVLSEGKLLPYFIGVRNGDRTALETVIKGNEKVLRARLADAEFFYEEDRNSTIDTYLEKLDRVVFQEKLGTMREKSKRVQTISNQIASKQALSPHSIEQVVRAAEISKFDLVTEMVNEFTELEGVIGEIYAKHFNEDDEVAIAIREQYLPAHATDDLPETETGAVLSVAEKIDTIVGIIAVGLNPTGSQDPYALRRQAIGVLRILEDRKWDISLEEILDLAFHVYDSSSIEKVQDYKEKIHDFFRLRALFLAKEKNIEQDIFQAVMGSEIGNFTYSINKAQILSEKRHEEAFKNKEEALVRVLNLADKAESNEIHPNYFETESEKDLYEKYQASNEAFQRYNQAKQAEEAFEQLEVLADPIHKFFDNNMVMTDNELIKNNRLALLRAIADLILSFGDLTEVEWKQNF